MSSSTNSKKPEFNKGKFWPWKFAPAESLSDFFGMATLLLKLKDEDVWLLEADGTSTVEDVYVHEPLPGNK